MIKGRYFPAIIEGDSRVLIQMAKKMANGKDCAKVATSWRLASKMDSLKTMFRAHSDVSFCHVRRIANKATDLLANADVEGDTRLRIGSLDEFNVDAWAQKCRQVATREFDDNQQMEHSDDRGVGNDKGREQA